ncbi:MAG: DivIVA domain-containing protein [Nesterenkonia sp.]
MALTPEDLLNKDFPETKFRPGYDKDEVDDFLDEVVVEWRRLLQENEELSSEVASLQNQLDDSPDHVEPDELNDAGLSGYTGTSAEVTGTVERVPDQAEETNHTEPVEGTDAAATDDSDDYAPGTRPAQERPTAAPAAADAEQPAAEAAGVLAMAQRLHDQYVAEGEQQRTQLITEGETRRDTLVSEGTSKRDELVAEGEKTREQYITEGEQKRSELVTDAETRAENMIEEAELTSTRTLNALERKKSDLEGRVSELTSFERDYRARLKDYIEGQLNELNVKGSIEKETSGTD